MYNDNNNYYYNYNYGNDNNLLGKVHLIWQGGGGWRYWGAMKKLLR